MAEHNYTISQIANLVGNQNFLSQPDQIIVNLLTDSRKVINASHSLFFALKGRKNSHQYIQNLYQQGVRDFVYYDRQFDIAAFPDANFIYSENPVKALQLLSIQHRKQFDFPVIGITGSNGKTIVKEWLYQLLAKDYAIVRSPRSYNSQIGVPLSVWKMSNSYNMALFEAGISQPNEMENLQKVILPTIGIFTNIGSSHDEGFADTTQKIKEKFKLFKESEILICNKRFEQYAFQHTKVITWSKSDPKADLFVNDIREIENNTRISAVFRTNEINISIPFNDKAAVENAITCWLILLELGVDNESIQNRMLRLQPVTMRLEMKSGVNNCSVIDDSYNSDLSSLEIALDFLAHQKQHEKKTLILSDIQQSGLSAEELYKKVADLLESKEIDRLIGIGNEISQYKALFSPSARFYSHTDTFIQNFKTADFRNETILIKGARDFGFERISKALSQQVHETVLEINLNAMEHNLNYYRSKLAPGVKLMTMVKAFGYGSGSFEIANLLQFNHVDYLAVAYADEGVTLRQNGITLPIMVMSPESSSIEAIVMHHLEPEIFSYEVLTAFTEYLKDKNIKNYPIHLKVDTGMHRLGFMPDDVDELVDYLLLNHHVKIQSVFSHLVGSESAQHDDFTKQQISLFKAFAAKLEDNLKYTFIKHICNTSAITRWPEAQFDMVRLGIGLYGVDNFTDDDKNLEHVATLKTTVSQIKQLKKGETVGYGRKGVMFHDGKTATVKIGYADGYLRALGNGIGTMLINNQEVSTVGNICMDMCMLDVTDKNVQVGDEVIIFDSQKSLYKMAEKLNTIPYEVLTNVSQRVKRVYYYE